MPNGKWSEEEDQKSKKLIENGATLKEVAKRLGRSTPSVYHRNAEKWNYKFHHTYNPDLTSTPTIAYLLGTLAGDGSTCHSGNHWMISLGSKDKEFAIAFRDALRSIGIYGANIGSYTYITTLRPYKKIHHVCYAACKKFVVWHKQLTLEKIEKMLDDEDKMFAFLRGFYDSEGSVNQNPKCGTVSITFCNTNPKLIALSSSLLKKLGYTVGLSIGNCGQSRKTLYRQGILGTTDQKVAFLKKLNSSIPRKSIEKLDMKNLPKEKQIRWMKDEDNILVEHYPKYPTTPKEEIMKKLPGRSWLSIKARAYFLHLHSSWYWTKEEEGVLIKDYPRSSKKGIQKQLPNRTWEAIIAHAGESGLRRPYFWADNEKRILQEHATNTSIKKLMKMLPNRSRSAIKNQKHKLIKNFPKS